MNCVLAYRHGGRGTRNGLLAFLTLIVGLAVLLSGCAGNPYKQFYQSAPASALEQIAQRRVAPAPEMPELYHGSDPKNDVAALAADGYVIIGSSSYNGPHRVGDALQQGKAVGADRILIYGKYARTVQTTLPLTLPTTQTSITNGNATAFGPGGMATAYGSALHNIRLPNDIHTYVC